MMYQLKTPINARKNKQDFLITELTIPEVVTVGMMAAAQRESGTNETLAHPIDMAAQIAGLDPFTSAKLTLSDAIGYAKALNDSGLMDGDVDAIELPAIKPLRASLKGVTATHYQPIELALQILDKSGYPRAGYLDVDIRAFAPSAVELLTQLIDPK